MRSRNISCSTIIQNMAQLKEQFKDSWETIPSNSDTLLYLGGNEFSTHKYISEALGKSTIDTKTHGETKGKSCMRWWRRRCWAIGTTPTTRWPM